VIDMMGWYGPGAGWMMLLPLFWIALIALAVWAVIVLSRGWPNRSSGPGAGQRATPDTGETWRETPREILDRRLAAGEIDPETYDELRSRLSGHESDRR
jgi:putative membrane protein